MGSLDFFLGVMSYIQNGFGTPLRAFYFLHSSTSVDGFFLIYTHARPLWLCCRLHVHRSSALAVRGKKPNAPKTPTCIYIYIIWIWAAGGAPRRRVVPNRNKGVSVTLTNSQIDRRREPI